MTIPLDGSLRLIRITSGTIHAQISAIAQNASMYAMVDACACTP